MFSNLLDRKLHEINHKPRPKIHEDTDNSDIEDDFLTKFKKSNEVSLFL